MSGAVSSGSLSKLSPESIWKNVVARAAAGFPLSLLSCPLLPLSLSPPSSSSLSLFSLFPCLSVSPFFCLLTSSSSLCLSSPRLLPVCLSACLSLSFSVSRLLQGWIWQALFLSAAAWCISAHFLLSSTQGSLNSGSGRTALSSFSSALLEKPADQALRAGSWGDFLTTAGK